MKDIKIEFIEEYRESDYDLKFVVIPSRYNGKWIYGRHKDRSTWEVPGGHIEAGETSMDAAKREVYEECGAMDFDVTPICIYNVKVNDTNSYGMLYFAQINKLSSTLEYEIEEITLHDNIPDNLTYPDIQPYLYERVKECLRNNNTASK